MIEWQMYPLVRSIEWLTISGLHCIEVVNVPHNEVIRRGPEGPVTTIL